MKSANPHGACTCAQQVFDTLTHLARRLIGEGDRHDTHRGCAFHPGKPGNTMHQNACFATARTSLHQQVPGR